MSFAELVTEMTGVCFSTDAGLGESASYTGPEPGAVASGVRAVIDEPNQDPFARERPRSGFKERIVWVWIERLGTDGTPVTLAKDGTLVVTTSHGVVRTLVLVSPQEFDPDRSRWSAREEAA